MIAETVPEGLRRHLLRIKWIVVVAWREVSGRWFVFRDCPDWFVAEVASWQFEDCDDEMQRLKREADKEASLRELKLSRRAECAGNVAGGNTA